jgi:putative copper export protein
MNSLTPTIDAIRISLHIFAVAVWVGGQVVIAAVVPALRPDHRAALPLVAKGFARVAWPSFMLAVVTGMWSLLVVDVSSTSGGYQVAMLLKVFAVLLSGAAAAVHSAGSTTAVKAIGGALGLVFALSAVVLGVLIRAGA